MSFSNFPLRQISLPMPEFHYRGSSFFLLPFVVSRVPSLISPGLEFFSSPPCPPPLLFSCLPGKFFPSFLLTQRSSHRLRETVFLGICYVQLASFLIFFPSFGLFPQFWLQRLRRKTFVSDQACIRPVSPGTLAYILNQVPLFLSRTISMFFPLLLLACAQPACPSFYLRSSFDECALKVRASFDFPFLSFLPTSPPFSKGTCPPMGFRPWRRRGWMVAEWMVEPLLPLPTSFPPPVFP